MLARLGLSFDEQAVLVTPLPGHPLNIWNEAMNGYLALGYN